MTKLHGKRMLITGAASGIGRATAMLAAKRGASVVLTDRDARNLDAVANAVRGERGVVLEARAFDITDVDAVRAFADAVHEAHGSLDVIMNNAGIAQWGTIERMPYEAFRNVVDVNLLAPIHILERFVPPMIAAGRGGHVINVSSAAGLFGLPWHAAYSASKFGLRGLSEVLRFDLRRHGIHVSLVCPGGVRTELVETVKVFGVEASSPRFQRMKRVFERHAVTPEQAAVRILRGVEKNRYLVYTSLDIAIGHWLAQRFPWSYAQVMRLMNAQFDRAVLGTEGDA